jgi:lipid A 3-O-deacylase
MPMRRLQLVATVIMSFLSPGLGGSASAAALVSEIRGGVLAHNVNHLFGYSNREDGLDGNVEVLFAPFSSVAGGALRSAVGGTVSFTGETSLAYADVRYERELPNGLFFGFGLGAAVHDGPLDERPNRKALGSRVLFHIPAEIGWRLDRHNSLSLYFEHVSNAGLADRNHGMDNMGVRYGYRF